MSDIKVLKRKVVKSTCSVTEHAEAADHDDDAPQLFSASIVKAVKKKKKAVSTDDKVTSLVDTSKINSAKNFGFNIEWNNTPYDPTFDFTKLQINVSLVQTLKRLSITKPTEIQQRCIPAILSGRDVVGRAKTGSGKTATFALPILQTLSADPYGIYALVLTPTRELAFQIEDQFKILGLSMNIETAVVVGGLDMMKQVKELEARPHVVVATPGRLSDLLIRGNLRFPGQYIKFLVMDEADRLFEPCFAPFIDTILDYIPPVGERQTLLFSATITKPMLEANLEGTHSGFPRLMVDPIYVEASTTEDAVVDTLDQRYLVLPQTVKECYLHHMLKCLDEEHPDYNAARSVIIFVGTCRGATFISSVLRELGIPNVALHSQVPQPQRLSNLAKFRSGYIKVLVATDVAARGLDIPSVQLVINYDVPKVTADYVHRVGRTARAGRGGMAVTFVSQYDIDLYKAIEESIHKELPAYEVIESEVLEELPRVVEVKKVVQIKLRDFSVLADDKPENSKKKRVDAKP